MARDNKQVSANILIGDVAIPLGDFAVAGTAWLGIKKAGKTYGAKGVAEQLISHGVPLIVFDAIGLWRFLKTPGDGHDSKGYKVVVAGGEEPDIPLTAQNASEIIRAAMRSNVSLVIDLYDPKLSKADWRKIVQTGFHTLLYENKQHGPRYIILEEAAEFCLDSQTEVLTNSGWKIISNVSLDDQVSCFDIETKSYSWEPPQRLIRKAYHGPMVHIKSRSIDCLMTADHRAVIQRYQHSPKRFKIYPPTFCEASKLPQSFLIPMGGAACGKTCLVKDDLLRIIGWVATDGHYHSAGRKYLSISQSEASIKRGQSIVDKMRRVLLPMGATEHQRLRRGVMRGKELNSKPSSQFFLGVNLSRLILDITGSKIHRIPTSLINSCSRGQLFTLWEALLEGDGTSNGGKWRCFYPGHEEGLADDFQEISLRLGVRTTKNFTAGQWRVSIASKHTDHWICKEKISRRDFDGDVFCLTVPTGAFVARRNGRVFVTGNCPQKVYDGETYAAVEKLARMGGNAGLGLALINQRSQEVNKAVLDLCDNLVLLRQRGSAAIEAVQKWMDKVSPDIADKIAASLPQISAGECWVWAENSETPVYTKTHKLHSFHPDRTKHGENIKTRQSVDTAEFVSTLLSELPKVVEEKKANDPAELKRKIRELEHQIKHAVKDKSPDPIVEKVPVLDEDSKQLLIGVENACKTAAIEAKRNADALETLYKSVVHIKPRLETSLAGARIPAGNIPVSRMVKPAYNRLPIRPAGDVSNGDGTLSGGRKAVLIAAAQHPNGVTDEQIAVLTGYKKTSRTTFKQQLMSQGLLTQGGLGFVATEEGIKALGHDYDPLPTGDQLREHWMQRLSGGELSVFAFVVARYPEVVSKDDIGEQANYKLTSVNTFCQKLSVRQLITTSREGVRAADNLFE